MGKTCESVLSPILMQCLSNVRLKIPFPAPEAHYPKRQETPIEILESSEAVGDNEKWGSREMYQKDALKYSLLAQENFTC